MSDRGSVTTVAIEAKQVFIAQVANKQTIFMDTRQVLIFTMFDKELHSTTISRPKVES